MNKLNFNVETVTAAPDRLALRLLLIGNRLVGWVRIPVLRRVAYFDQRLGGTGSASDLQSPVIGFGALFSGVSDPISIAAGFSALTLASKCATLCFVSSLPRLDHVLDLQKAGTG